MNRRWARYVAEDPALRPLYAWEWRDPPWLRVIQERRAYPLHRRVLVEALLRQNQPWLAQDPVLREAIEALGNENSFTITTGQQPGWLTGPLYTLIKAVHTIQLSHEVEQQLQGKYRIIPVFWIASEDHDVEEVVSIKLDWEKSLRYNGVMQGAVGRHEIEAAFPPEAESLGLQRFWQTEEKWENAFRAAMQSVFAGKGIVWISPDDSELKALGLPLWEREVCQQATRSAHLPTVSYLKAIREKPVLHAQPINLFWLKERERRYPYPEESSLLRRIIYTHPEALSPNVFLRPVFQEMLLPNLAYVAGPGEVRYWLELRGVFEAMEVPMPVLYPRGHLRIVRGEPPILPGGWQVEHLWNYPVGQLRAVLARSWGEALIEEVRSWIIQHQPRLERWKGSPFWGRAARMVEWHWERIQRELYQVAKKAAFHQYRELIEAAVAYRLRIEPEGRLQERELNIHAFAPQHPQEWVHRMIKEVSFCAAQWGWMRS
ncbi:MAG: bacillithiol biosynthesis cysteine-adding enzyme BshC [Bacteroidia bacterium]|nr:bacillithiol biosynthesis cysteine-adding enzyme BshC [Bacteroidia bacterium]MDW8235324.1 bacillithiol biosynthesis BshC [Bacteroidia bacterium]